MGLTRVGARALTRVGAIVLAMAGAIAPIARAGGQAPEAPAFDVASVKENASGDSNGPAPLLVRFEMTWRPAQATARPDVDGVSIFTALQEQLGLK